MEVRDPYQAPAAVLTATPSAPVVPGVIEEEWVHPELFAPSTGKLVVMSLTSLGLYVLYWFYRNWRAIADQEGTAIWPFWRAVFAPLWGFSCFAQLNRYASGRRRQLAFPPVVLALVYLLINAVANWSVLFPRDFGRNLWVLGLFTFLPLLPMNSLMRGYQQSLRMDMRRQDRLTVWHVLVIVFGGLFVGLALLGALLR
ncbi:hypothetical protein [Stenotrophomonas sp. SY1]|uniref:hypothetical protein n=1 Tax=Stenotrophomonas sp. SY1 TaxID=477235 RepID=UPI001E538152|nr:hypothetical protein [Stenotrophomonas sp. SY1]MCD9087822.1 hypothetical protein [Stenotrophomonas sp. SY1]